MTKMLKPVGLLALVMAMMLVLAACGAQTDDAPAADDPPSTADPAPSDSSDSDDDADGRYGGDFLIGMGGSPQNLNPLVWLAQDNWHHFYHVYDSLFRLDENLEPQGQLVESWDISDDGLTYTLRLKQGVLFHDGEPMTAEDVAFTFYGHLNPAVNSALRTDLRMLVGWDELTDIDNPADPDDLDVKPVEIVDDHTVVIRLENPFAPFLTIIASPRFAIAPKHIMESEADLNVSVTNREPVGTGPWKLVEWLDDERVVYEAFEDYHDGRAFFDRMVYRIIPEEALRISELEAGAVHFVGQPTAIHWRRLVDHPEVEALIANDELTMRVFTINHMTPELQDIRVRRALMHAFDSEELVEGLNDGFGSISGGPIGPASWAYHPDTTQYEFSPDRARELLAEAGYSDGDLQFELVTGNTGPSVAFGELAQERYREVGIDISLAQLDSVGQAERRNTGNFDLVYVSWSGSPDPHPNFNRRHHSQGGSNVGKYSNPRVDELIEMAVATSDIDQRKALYAEYQEIVTEEVADVFLYHPVRFYAHRQEVTNFFLTPVTEHPVEWFHEAYFVE
ncbi:MAG: ABC transporter substrate-binding protein [Thermaerobacterales bacterium]